MSDYCGSCFYDPRQSTGPRACPFNALYWDFMARNQSRLDGNVRMAMPLRTLDRMDPTRLSALGAHVAGFLDALDRGNRV